MFILLSVCCASTEIKYGYLNNQLRGQIDIQIGAYPGFSTKGLLNLNISESVVKPAPEYYSATVTGDGDYVYVNGPPQFVRVQNTVDVSNIGWDILAAKGVFGVCDNMLYMSEVPRHCKRGKSGARQCRRQHCNINLGNQHRGTCRDGVALLTFGVDYSIEIPCDVTEFMGSLIPVVADNNDPSLSLVRGEYNFQYDDATNKFTIWEKADSINDLISLGIMAVLALGLAAWLGWTRALNKLVKAPNNEDAFALWRRLANVGLVIGDASWLAASVKVYHFAISSHSFMPEALDFLLGEAVAAMYCVWYLGVVCGMTLVVLYILLLAMIDAGMQLPDSIARPLAKGVAACRTGPGCLAALVATRWLFETVLLTALHISTPDALGRSFKDVVGIGIGLAVAAVSGRDAQTLTSLTNNIATRIVISIALVLVLGHVAIFMVFPCVASSYNQNNLSLLVASVVTVQTAVASALLHTAPAAKHFESRGRSEPKNSLDLAPF